MNAAKLNEILALLKEARSEIETSHKRIEELENENSALRLQLNSINEKDVTAEKLSSDLDLGSISTDVQPKEGTALELLYESYKRLNEF